MTDPEQRKTPPLSETGAGPASSIHRRRDILKRLGQASAMAGVASPIAALAGGSGRPWCYKDKTCTTVVGASISGVGSVLISAQVNGTQNYGNSCSHFNNSGNIPSGCGGVVFKSVFSCSGKDSLGQPLSSKYCLFNQTISGILCSSNPAWTGSAEAHWATAYCNASRYSTNSSSSTFPYSQSQVCSYFSDVNNKAAAYSFFCGYMENVA